MGKVLNQEGFDEKWLVLPQDLGLVSAQNEGFNHNACIHF